MPAPAQRPTPQGVGQLTALSTAPIGFIIVGIGLGVISYGLVKNEKTRGLGGIGFGIAGAAILAGILNLRKN